MVYCYCKLYYAEIDFTAENGVTLDGLKSSQFRIVFARGRGAIKP
jgi:hypothetical protein